MTGCVISFVHCAAFPAPLNAFLARWMKPIKVATPESPQTGHRHHIQRQPLKMVGSFAMELSIQLAFPHLLPPRSRSETRVMLKPGELIAPDQPADRRGWCTTDSMRRSSA